MQINLISVRAPVPGTGADISAPVAGQAFHQVFAALVAAPLPGTTAAAPPAAAEPARGDGPAVVAEVPADPVIDGPVAVEPGQASGSGVPELGVPEAGPPPEGHAEPVLFQPVIAPSLPTPAAAAETGSDRDERGATTPGRSNVFVIGPDTGAVPAAARAVDADPVAPPSSPAPPLPEEFAGANPLPRTAAEAHPASPPPPTSPLAARDAAKIPASLRPKPTTQIADQPTEDQARVLSQPVPKAIRTPVLADTAATFSLLHLSPQRGENPVAKTSMQSDPPDLVPATAAPRLTAASPPPKSLTPAAAVQPTRPVILPVAASHLTNAAVPSAVAGPHPAEMPPARAPGADTEAPLAVPSAPAGALQPTSAFESIAGSQDPVRQATRAERPQPSAGGLTAAQVPTLAPLVARGQPEKTSQPREIPQPSADTETAPKTRAANEVAPAQPSVTVADPSPRADLVPLAPPPPDVAPHHPDRPHRMTETAQVADIARQIAPVIDRLADGATEIRLDPAELGRLRLTVQATDTAVTMTIQVERPETADLMRRHLDGLVSDLRAQGYAEVAIRLDGDRGGDGGGRQAPANYRHQTALPDRAPADSPPAPQRPRGGALDLRL